MKLILSETWNQLVGMLHNQWEQQSQQIFIQAKHRQPFGLAYMENDKRQKQKL